VNSVVSLRTVTNASNVPIVVFADMQQESGTARPLQMVCRSMIGALPRIHKVPYPCDASSRHALEEVSADKFHRTVSNIAGLSGNVQETDDWIASTLLRKLGIGKNAGG
jgi:hypothetical protein